MKTRHYQSCRQCHGRMKAFAKDEDGEQIFYYCPKCAKTGVLYVQRNFWSDNWPAKIFKKSIERGIFDKKGHLIEQ